MSYGAVFFDAGETLIHPHPTFPDLFAQILEREGHAVAPETIGARGQVVFDRFRQAAETNELWTTSPERSRRFWHDVYRIFLHELEIPNANGLIDVVYREFTDVANYRVFDDVPPVLERLRAAGSVLGVISNFEEWLDRLLADLAIRSYFPVRVISGIEGIEKPDPRIFRLALERLGVPPGRAVYVGDLRSVDEAGARAAGMHFVLVDPSGGYAAPGTPAIAKLDDLPALLASRFTLVASRSAPNLPSS